MWIWSKNISWQLSISLPFSRCVAKRERISKLVHHYLFFHDFQWAFATLYACFMTSPFRVNCSELNSIWTCNVNSKMNSHSALWRSWFYSKIKFFSHSVFISELFIAMLHWHFCLYLHFFISWKFCVHNERWRYVHNKWSINKNIWRNHENSHRTARTLHSKQLLT